MHLTRFLSSLPSLASRCSNASLASPAATEKQRKPAADPTFKQRHHWKHEQYKSLLIQPSSSVGGRLTWYVASAKSYSSNYYITLCLWQATTEWLGYKEHRKEKNYCWPVANLLSAKKVQKYCWPTCHKKTPSQSIQFPSSRLYRYCCRPCKAPDLE